VDWSQAFWLALIQGVTEFLPISSSGHLVLVPSLFGWTDQGLAFDVAVHVGTLVAVIAYFRKDIGLILGHWLRSLAGGPATVYSHLAWCIAFASVWVGLAGFALEDFVESRLRNPVSIAAATILFGILLGLADRYGTKKRQVESINWKDVLFISGAQILALVPGTSRSGITISAGLMMGLDRQASARFSFLLAIPVIAMAGAWQAKGLVTEPGPVNWPILAFATGIAALVAMVCIHYFMRYLEKFGLVPFALYRVVLGVILLAVFL